MNKILFNLNTCPYCKEKLIESFVDYKNKLKIPCLECKTCKLYLFTKSNYSYLERLAKEENRKLNSHVRYYTFPEFTWNDGSARRLLKKEYSKDNKITKINKKKKTKSKKIIKKTEKSICDIPCEIVKKSKTIIDINVLENCLYFKNKICTYYNESCNPYSIKCKNKNIFKEKIDENANIQSNKTEKHYIQNVKYVKSVVLSYNRKCFNDNHTIIDITAIIRVATYSGIIELQKPVAYCPECNQYIILKSDFISIKKKGVLLCEVIDKTPKHLENHKYQSYLGTESKIHALGYNVIKEYGYTYKQRKVNGR